MALRAQFIQTDSGRVSVDSPALEDPSNTADLAAYLEETNRPAFTPAATPSTIYVDTTGDDVTGDGSVGNPFATIAKALQLIGTLNDSTITIQLGAGTFNMPALLSEANWVTLLGTTSIAQSRTISTVDTLSDAGGIALTIDGGPFANDALRGQLIEWTSGAASGDFGWIYRNTGNQIFVTNEDPTSIPAIIATDTLDFIDLDTDLEYTDTPVMENSVQLNIQKVNMTDDLANGRVLFILSTDKVQFRYCNWTMARPQVGGFGRGDFWCNYLGCKGDTGRGVVAARKESFTFFERGTVIDCGLNTSAANKRFMQFSSGATISYLGMVVVREIDDAKGIQCDGTDWSADGGITSHDTFRFETEGASASCIAGFVFNTTGEGIGGEAQLPNLHGEVTSSYVVTAQDNAYIELGSSSSAVTATVTNAISANNGTAAVFLGDDTTLIIGGDPAPDPSAIIDLSTQTTQGFLPPTMTDAEITAIASPAEGLMVYNTDTDKLYQYDGTRSKWLSIESTALQFAQNGGTDNAYLRFGGNALDGNSGARMPFDATIVHLTIQQDVTAGNLAKQYDIEINGVLSFSATTAAGLYSDTTLSTDVSAGDRINIFATAAGAGANSPYAVLWVKFRS